MLALLLYDDAAADGNDDDDDEQVVDVREDQCYDAELWVDGWRCLMPPPSQALTGAPYTQVWAQPGKRHRDPLQAPRWAVWLYSGGCRAHPCIVLEGVGEGSRDTPEACCNVLPQSLCWKLRSTNTQNTQLIIIWCLLYI